MLRPKTLLALSLLAAAVIAQEGALAASQLDGLRWRSIGPANMGGRITDLAVRPDKPSVFFVAAATGGLWRTTSGGTTFESVFDGQGSGSIGAVTLAPTNSEIVWVGTGEANARNSCSYGDGVYKSTDGGGTWKNMGLRESRHVGAIAVHPADADVVFVAALGHVWGANPMRGLYRTRDGGETWLQVLAIDDATGCIDVLFHPGDPEVVYAAAYAVRRDGFDTNDPAIKYGEHAGIYRSTDGGTNWSKLSGGLPTVKYGRVGLDVCQAHPDHLFAVVETEFTGRPAPVLEGDDAKGGPAYLGVRSEDAEEGRGALVLEVISGAAAEKAGVKKDDVIVDVGGREVADYDSMIEAIGKHRSGDEAQIVVKRGEERVELALTFGPRQAPRIPGTLGGQGANAVKRQGPTGYQTGGVYLSKDRGDTWTRLNSLTPRPFYYSQIRVDPTDPERMWVLGTQLHVSSNGGQKFVATGARGIHVDHHAMWIDERDPRHLILGNDGGVHESWDRGKTWEALHLMALGQFYGVAVDDRAPYRVYGGLQDNGSWGFPSHVRSTYGITHDHVFRIGSGDGFLCAVDPDDNDIVYCESQNGNISRVNVRTGETARVRRPGDSGGGGGPGRGRGRSNRYRFNWETPFMLSPHNSRILYWAGDKVLRSIDGGKSSKEISGDITATPRGTASALSVSPRAEGVVWVGTDDGSLRVTRDDGREWKAVEGNLPALAHAKWISHIECSRTDGGTAYVVVDGHRSHDFNAHIWRTTDYGDTFECISGGLPSASARVLREDPVNPDVLYVGLEIGVFVSIDRGSTWSRLRGDFPTVRVDDLAIQGRKKELVVGTHGRSVWVVDCAPLQELTSAVVKKDLHLFAPKEAVQWIRNQGGGRYGARRYRAKPEAPGALISYWLGRKPGEDEDVSVEIRSADGKPVATVKASKHVGINQVVWPFSRASERGRGGRGRGRGGRGGRGGSRSAPLGPGTYRVTVSMGDRSLSAPLQVVADPRIQSESGDN